jgi:N-acetylglucosamine kinase-like BadF-type ATPase
MPGSEAAVLVGVDAGGTQTVVRWALDGRPEQTFTLGSVNPASVGPDAAAAVLGELFQRFAAVAGGEPVVGWIGSAAVTGDTADRVAATVADVARRAGLTGRLALTEDATVLLLAPPLDGIGVVAIVGTGAITVARDATGRLVQCGGYEYLLADEGSGFDLGLFGLRAAAQAFDGRGPRTALLDRLAAEYRLAVPALGVELAATAHPKPVVARFARAVCECAEAGDAVAADLVDRAARAVAHAVASARRQLAEPPLDVALAGAVVTGSDSYRRQLTDHLRSVDPGLRPHVVTEPARSAFALARMAQAGHGPAALADVVHRWIRLPDG